MGVDDAYCGRLYQRIDETLSNSDEGTVSLFFMLFIYLLFRKMLSAE